MISLFRLDVAAQELALLLLEVLPERVRVGTVHIHLPHTVRKRMATSQNIWRCLSGDALANALDVSDGQPESGSASEEVCGAVRAIETSPSAADEPPAGA